MLVAGWPGEVTLPELPQIRTRTNPRAREERSRSSQPCCRSRPLALLSVTTLCTLSVDTSPRWESLQNPRGPRVFDLTPRDRSRRPGPTHHAMVTVGFAQYSPRGNTTTTSPRSSSAGPRLSGNPEGWPQETGSLCSTSLRRQAAVVVHSAEHGQPDQLAVRGRWPRQRRVRARDHVQRLGRTRAMVEITVNSAVYCVRKSMA